MKYAIQIISTHALCRDGDHADWQTFDEQSGVDYANYASTAEGVARLEMDDDCRCSYRIVEVAGASESYQELEAENLDALEALEAWEAAGCPRVGNEIEALRRAAIYRASAAPVKAMSTPKKVEAA